MNNFKQHGTRMIKLIFAYVVATILLLWGWNSALPDLFGVPAMQFKQATGIMILIGAISFVLRCGRHELKENASPCQDDSVMGRQS